VVVSVTPQRDQRSPCVVSTSPVTARHRVAVANASGYGNELTEFGIREFVTNKVIDVVDIDARSDPPRQAACASWVLPPRWSVDSSASPESAHGCR
jgi:hypothetical protein